MRLPGSSTIRFSLYVFSLQIKSVACLFWSPVCSPGRYRYLYRPSPGNTFSSGYVWYVFLQDICLSSSRIFSLVASFGFISYINDFVLFTLFTMLFRFLIQFSDTFSGSWSSWASMALNNCFSNSWLKASTKVVWVCLNFFVALRTSTLCFSSNFVNSLLNSDPLWHWYTFGHLNNQPYYILLPRQM